MVEELRILYMANMLSCKKAIIMIFRLLFFLVEDDAVEYSHCTFGDRYVVEVCKIIELQELMEEE